MNATCDATLSFQPEICCEPEDICNMANSSISTMVSTALSAIRSELTGVDPGGEQTRPEENDGEALYRRTVSQPKLQMQKVTRTRIFLNNSFSPKKEIFRESETSTNFR